jgi:hypothetical protein
LKTGGGAGLPASLSVFSQALPHDIVNLLLIGAYQIGNYQQDQKLPADICNQAAMQLDVCSFL